MNKSVEINSSDRLILPNGLTIKKVDDKFVVISPNTGNWIVLDNKTELSVLKDVRRKTIGDILSGENEEIARKVVTLIMARNFAGVNKPIIPKNEVEIDGMQIYLTHGCNLRCKHCYMYAGKAKHNELDLNQWKRILLDFKSNGVKEVTMSGGEVLLFKGFPELVEYAHTLGLHTLVYTNGLMWNEKLVKKLSSSIDSVQVSIDGYDEKSNAVVRGKHHFDKACDTVIYFAKYGVDVKIATTFILDNITEEIESKYKNFTDFLNKRAGKELEYHLTKSLIKGRNIDYTKEQNRRIAELMLSVQDTISPNSKYANFIEGHEPNILHKTCGYGKPTIDSNGDVYLCCTIEKLQPIGNVLNDSMEQILGKCASYRIGSDVEHIKECKDCELRYICNGGCRLENGSISEHLFSRDKCTDEFKMELLKQMKESFIHYYNY